MTSFTLWAAAGVVLLAAGLTIGWIDGRRACRAGQHHLAYEFGGWACVRCGHTTETGCRCPGCSPTPAVKR